MAAFGEAFKQEMPPEGGYRKLYFDRIRPKKFVTYKMLYIAQAISGGYFLFAHKIDRRIACVRDIENSSGYIAIQPIFDAEMDRDYLRQLRKNRDEEEELMKNVPGWEVGKLFDEPVFKTVPNDWLFHPSPTEYYIHTRLKYFHEFWHMRHYH